MGKTRKIRNRTLKHLHSRRQRPIVRRAIWGTQECKKCAAPCRIAEEIMADGRLIGTILELKPDKNGLLVRREDGYLVRDPDYTHPGKRYSWHYCPAING